MRPLVTAATRMTRYLPLCLMLIACGREPGGDPMRVVPADVAAAAIAPSLSLLQSRTAGFLAGIEGASGAPDLLADRFALDLRTPEGPAALGLDPERAVAVFTHGPARAWVAVASVADPERFLDEAKARLEKGAGAALVAGQPSAPPAGGAWHFAGPAVSPSAAVPGPGADKSTWHAALGVTADRIGILVIAPAAADVIGHWNAVASGRAEASFAASDKAASAKAALGADAVVYLVLEGLLPNAPKQLGLLRGFVQGMRDALPTFTGGVALPLGEHGVDALVLKLSAAHVGEGFLPVQWVTPKGSPDRLAQAFPKTTTAFLRFRVALDNVRSLPGFIRDSVLPERLPGLESLPLPAVNDIIDLVEGDIAVAVLGLDVKANLGRLGALRSAPSEALTMFHLALAARMRDATATKRTFSGIASQLETSGWTVARIGGAGSKVAPGATPYEGWSLARDGNHYAVLIDDQVVVFLVGAGEVEGFLAVKEGRALSLASFAERGSATVKQALGLEGATAMGLGSPSGLRPWASGSAAALSGAVGARAAAVFPEDHQRCATVHGERRGRAEAARHRAGDLVVTASAPLIRLVDLHKSYGEGAVTNHVLRGLTLEVNKGEMVAITGASGSGKSTLLNIIGGLDQTYSGQVEVAGERVVGLADKALSRYRNRTVGFIFQQFHLLPHLSVVDNVCLPSWFDRSHETKRKDLRAAATKVLTRVGIGHKAEARPNHLSGGERQRVAIARALFNHPTILLCDEPTGALDSQTTETVFDLIVDLNKQDGLTVLVVTHERDIARRCPRRVHIVDGRVATDERDAAAAGAAASAQAVTA